MSDIAFRIETIEGTLQNQRTKQEKQINYFLERSLFVINFLVLMVTTLSAMLFSADYKSTMTTTTTEVKGTGEQER